MKKEEKASISIMKIICISIILILIAGIGVMAVNTQLNDVKIILQNGYEMTALTSKTKVADILEENNIILEDNQKTIPDIESEIVAGETIKITDKTYNEVQIAKISENGVETSLNQLLENYAPITEKIVVEQVAIPYETVTKNTTNSTTGTTNKVIQQGKDGLKEVTYKVKYQNNVEIEKNVVSEVVIKEPVNKIVQVQKVTSRSTLPRNYKATGSVYEYQQYAKAKCYEYGWSESDFNCVVYLWNKESGWNPTAYNKRSGAYGIPQALPATKMASAGSDYMTNYKTQINWGLSYIKSRYGTPTAAYNHSQTKGWY